MHDQVLKKSVLPKEKKIGRLSDDILLPAQLLLGHPGQTMLEAMNDSDMTDVWEGGACGGACACSTCRYVACTLNLCEFRLRQSVLKIKDRS